MTESVVELWGYRELFYFLAWRDVKVRYKQAALGAAWAVLQPLLSMIVFSVLFGRLAGIPTDGIPYPLFAYCALLPWTYFSGALSLGGNSLVTNANLLTKVYFPRILLPASSALSGLLDFAIGSVFLVVLMAYYHVQPTFHLLLYPVFIGALWFLALGLSMWLAALNVRYRDIKHAIPFLIQLLLFVTPVIYPTTFVPLRFRPLLALNPLTGIIEGFRSSVFPGPRLDSALIVTSAIVTMAIFVTGLMYFRRTERTFADIV